LADFVQAQQKEFNYQISEKSSNAVAVSWITHIDHTYT